MLPFLWSSNAFRSSSVTPAARSLLPEFLKPENQVLLGFFPFACSSAFLKSCTSDDLVDVPDTVPLAEAGDRFSRHCVSPGRPQ